MVVDCKVIDIVDLVCALENDKNNWQDLGEVYVPQADISPRSKQSYKDELAEHAHLQQKNRAQHTEAVISTYQTRNELNSRNSEKPQHQDNTSKLKF